MKTMEQLAQRYGVSTEAVTTLLGSLVAGNGTMAQFSHPELGGTGQWSRGGMVMIGDMFNSALKAKVDGLCSELAKLVEQEPAHDRSNSSQSQGQEARDRDSSLFVPAVGGGSTGWWGDDFGAASATGSQNHIRYAFFPAARRLAVAIGDDVTLYDTEDHNISGVSQQQSGDASMTFVSQRGTVRLADLQVVSKKKDDAPVASRVKPVPMPATGEQPPKAPVQADDIFLKLERLAELHTKGVLSDEEFSAKKTELLARL